MRYSLAKPGLFRRQVCAQIVATFCTILSLSMPANAQQVRWQLQNVTFDACLSVVSGNVSSCAAGGSASGFFVVESTTSQILDWSIVVSGGDQTLFPDVSYSPQNSSVTTGVTPFFNNGFIRFSIGSIRRLALTGTQSFWTTSTVAALNIGEPDGTADKSSESFVSSPSAFASRWLGSGIVRPSGPSCNGPF